MNVKFDCFECYKEINMEVERGSTENCNCNNAECMAKFNVKTYKTKKWSNYKANF
jgi:hypothetical protein